MSEHVDIVRAWKDEEYRLSLSEAARSLLPENPAGLIELSDADLRQNAAIPTITITFALCPGPSLLYCPSMITVCPSNVTICLPEKTAASLDQ